MTTQNEVRHAKDDLADRADAMKSRIKDRAGELIEDGKEALDSAGGRVRSQIQEKPVTSLLIAAGVGVLVGMLIARKR